MSPNLLKFKLVEGHRLQMHSEVETNQTKRLIPFRTKALIAAAVWLQLAGMAMAFPDASEFQSASGVLQAETPAVEPTEAGTADEAKLEESKTLFGGVKRHQTLGADSLSNRDANSLQAQKTAENPIRALAAQKLQAGVELNSEEYRSLEAGCVGYESYRPFFQPIARVTVVYTGSPADIAGIRKGDKIFAREDATDIEAKKDPTKPLEQVSLGLAGTPVDITVLRHGHPVVLNLVRMNIEDIKETVYRRQWEELIRNLGYPENGNFVGPDLRTLKPAVSAADNL